jgi:hypothetical protein
VRWGVPTHAGSLPNRAALVQQHNVDLHASPSLLRRTASSLRSPDCLSRVVALTRRPKYQPHVAGFRGLPQKAAGLRPFGALAEHKTPAYSLDRAAVVASTIVIWPPRLIAVPSLLLATGCVPTDPPDGSSVTVSPMYAASVSVARWRPRPETRIKTESTSHFNATGSTWDGTPDPALIAPFHEDFEGQTIDPAWLPTSNQWRLEGGQLCGQSARNHPIWLKRSIPPNARIAFVARALTDDGDIKVEAWGDGRSFAKGSSYADATSYVFILGGWKNQLHVLARLNEHDSRRLEHRIDPTEKDPRDFRVVPRRQYQFVIERKDGKSLIWRVDGVELFRFEDQEPLRGSRHDHFGFNNWESPVCFDDLTITPLSE